MKEAQKKRVQEIKPKIIFLNEEVTSTEIILEKKQNWKFGMNKPKSIKSKCANIIIDILQMFYDIFSVANWRCHIKIDICFCN